MGKYTDLIFLRKRARHGWRRFVAQIDTNFNY